MQPLRIAIQGGEASFHDIAARRRFAGQAVEIVECRTFREVCRRLAEGKADRSVMAIENSLAGSILPNYALLLEYPIRIAGEIYLRIEHHLLALPGHKLADIHTVRSHPMALLQCSDFLEKHPRIQGLETFDTAGSAREIAEKQAAGIAAIASREAASRYGLQVLAAGIQNLQENYTRFVVLERGHPTEPAGADKASVSFRIVHRPGSLCEVLQILKAHRINLTLIQSIPIPGRPQEYAFHTDLEWERFADFTAAVEQMKTSTTGLKLLGIYRKHA